MKRSAPKIIGCQGGGSSSEKQLDHSHTLFARRPGSGMQTRCSIRSKHINPGPSIKKLLDHSRVSTTTCGDQRSSAVTLGLVHKVQPFSSCQELVQNPFPSVSAA
mmetsp:Transcript_9228/g.21130  ORF Transcript_9228/g.21130 Transcript_9228/m.21130 type:complete len:105 (-) Transcript_9228:679-993(-)